MSKLKEFEQYFTPNSAASLLVESWSGQFNNVLDLSMGHGDLLAAVKDKYSKVQCVGVDIDESCISVAESRFKNGHFVHMDALNTQELSNELSLLKPFDGIVSNPPFTLIPNSPLLSHLIYKNLGLNIGTRNKIRAELVFLAHSIAYSRKGSTVSTILPLSFMKGASHKDLRSQLLKNHLVTHITKLPANTFKGAEVCTYAITFKAFQGQSNSVQLSEINQHGEYTSMLDVHASDAVVSMDAMYHEWQRGPESKLPKLRDFSATIRMGSIRHNTSKDRGIEAFHTTDFSSFPSGDVLFHDWSNDAVAIKNLVTAQEGDILVPRVGRNLNKGAIVVAGQAPITESVIKIQTSKKVQERVFQSLQSPAAKRWREVISSGSCTKMMPVRCMLDMPISE